MLERLDFVPNAFYDFIVFIGATLIFLSGLFVGLGLPHEAWMQQANPETLDVLLVILATIFLSYEYGRIAEAWSAVFVQKPLQFLGRRSRVFCHPDFLAKIPAEIMGLKFPQIPPERAGDKWTIYFYASLVAPRLGGDLLKRYAWEKLSRNSGFTFAILFLFSVTVRILMLFSVKVPWGGSWSFGTAEFSILAGGMVVVTYYEYYRRNCWNNDLLIKVLPVLLKAEDLLRLEFKSKGD